MFYPFFDSSIIILLPGIILALYAQNKVQSTYHKYSKIYSERGLTGGQAARMILDKYGLNDVRIETVGGRLSDHYDPRSRIVRLSNDVYQGTSIAAIGVAAHEVGHAIQHGTGYFPLFLRNTIIPVTQIGSNLSFPLLLIGILFSSPGLVNAGIILFSTVVLFQLITLPVEFNASSRVLGILDNLEILDNQEIKDTKKVLSAAALTYVAAALMAFLNLLRLLVLSRNFRD